jgi:signal transduction histidine kinase
VQEALVNVRKHARASTVTVRLETRDEGTSVIVEDDGVGIPPGHATSDPGHLGLRGMTERAMLMGGWLEVGPRPGGGTFVELWLPNSSARR